MGTAIGREALRMALEWVSAGPGSGNVAYVCRSTGRVHEFSDDFPLEEDPPGGFSDESRFAAVLHRRDLGLGKALVLAFMEEHLPDDHDAVRDIFRRPGAYACFKELLGRRGALQNWYDHQEKAEDEALADWAKANGFTVVEQ